MVGQLEREYIKIFAMKRRNITAITWVSRVDLKLFLPRPDLIRGSLALNR
jgi:hypothetical protein